MEFFPPLQLGWLNGWIPVLLFYGVFFILLKIFPKETVERLYDRSGWTDRQASMAKIGLPFALAAMLLIPFNQLIITHPVFLMGLAFFLIGSVGFISSLLTFNATPLGDPVTAGLYKISRNPQWVSFALAVIGIGFMVGSWTVLGLFLIRVIMNHFRILGEERSLKAQYGESYLTYKNSVPRYLLYF